jgi:hypothetical protein
MYITLTGAHIPAFRCAGRRLAKPCRLAPFTGLKGATYPFDSAQKDVGKDKAGRPRNTNPSKQSPSGATETSYSFAIRDRSP